MMEALQKLDYLDRASERRPATHFQRRPAADADRRPDRLPALAGGRPGAGGARTGSGGRAVVIAADEAAMRALAETVPIFAPEVEVLTLPAWDCLPYDRASPALRVMAERLATLQRAAGATRKARSCWSRPPMRRPSDS